MSGGRTEVEDKVLTIEINGQKSWIRQSQADAFRKLQDKSFNKMMILTGDRSLMDLHNARKQNKSDRRKYAYCYLGKTKILCAVDNITYQVYKCEGYKMTWYPQPNATFERWVTMMEL